MICPFCLHKVRVRKNGKFARHLNSQPVKYWSKWCLGYGQSAQQSVHTDPPSACPACGTLAEEPEHDPTCPLATADR